MENAVEWQLKLIRWQFFATLTFDPAKEGTRISRFDRFGAWLRNYNQRFCMRSARVPYTEGVFATRSERGELGGHPHFHALLAGAPLKNVNLNSCFALKNSWKHGIAQVRLYDPARNGVDYMTKARFGSAWAQGANRYEIRKFNSQDIDELRISQGAMRLMFQACSVPPEDAEELILLA